MVNVGKYTMHGSYEIQTPGEDRCLNPQTSPDFLEVLLEDLGWTQSFFGRGSFYWDVHGT